MDKLAQTIQSIRTGTDLNDSAICWLDGSVRSVLLCHLLQIVRPSTPVLIFPEFWDDKKRKKIYDLVDEWNIQAFYFSPMIICSRDKYLDSFYQTDSFTLNRADTFNASLMPKVMEFEAKPKLQPFYLWAHTYIASEPDAVFTGEKTAVHFPLQDWSDEEVQEAYTFLALPKQFLPQVAGDNQCQTLSAN